MQISDFHNARRTAQGPSGQRPRSNASLRLRHQNHDRKPVRSRAL